MTRLDAQAPGTAAQPFGSAVLESRVDVPVQKIPWFYDVHVGTHGFKAILCYYYASLGLCFDAVIDRA